MKIGIVGYGRFGQLWAETFKSFGEVKVYDPNPQRFGADAAFKGSSLKDVAKSDLVFLTVPISTLEAVCTALAPHLGPDTIVSDCCSVKSYPAEVMLRVLPSTQPVLATHPLFGPDSVRRTNGLLGHRIVVCPLRCTDDQKQRVLGMFAKLGLISIESTVADHDRDMARSQGLVHFIGRGLEALQLQPQLLSTPDFQALLNINAMVVNDAWQLFLDMHRYNPYAKAIRQSFLKQLGALDRSIGGSDDDKDA